MKLPKIVGVVNVTPDSFSDGGRVAAAHSISHALMLVAQGADMLDVGGESTRPGAVAVSVETELNRVLPVIEGIRKACPELPISIDTTKAVVAQHALQNGATIVNDVSAGTFDAAMFDVVAAANVPIILMHMQGKPSTMQQQPTYTNIVEEVYEFLHQRTQLAKLCGINNVIIDVGIGFGKTLNHNLELMQNLDTFATLHAEMMLGISRKAWLGTITGVSEPAERDAHTMLAHCIVGLQKAEYIRVHNVLLARQTLDLYSKLAG